MTSPRMFSSGPPELPGFDRRVGLQHLVGTTRHRPHGPGERRDNPDCNRVAEAEGRADGHHPVARRHPAGVAEPGRGQLPGGPLDQLEQPAVGQPVAAEHPRGVALVVAVELDLDAGGVLDQGVVGQDQAVVVEPGAGRRQRRALLLVLVLVTPARPIPVEPRGLSEEAVEVLAAEGLLAAAEELVPGNLRPRQLGPDGDDHRGLRLGGVPET